METQEQCVSSAELLRCRLWAGKLQRTQGFPHGQLCHTLHMLPRLRQSGGLGTALPTAIPPHQLSPTFPRKEMNFEPWARRGGGHRDKTPQGPDCCCAAKLCSQTLQPPWVETLKSLSKRQWTVLRVTTDGLWGQQISVQKENSLQSSKSIDRTSQQS